MSKIVEEWRPVVGYEGLYEVSDWGNVRSLNYNGTKNCRIMNGSVNEDGYIKMTLTKNKKKYTRLLHRLVAEAFIPNPNNYPVINHKDENTINNFYTNLEWCSVGYNNSYGTRLEKLSKTKTNGKTSKQVYQYTKDGELVKIWPSLNECKRNGLCATTISNCCLKKTHCKTYKGYIWSYVPL